MRKTLTSILLIAAALAPPLTAGAHTPLRVRCPAAEVHVHVQARSHRRPSPVEVRLEARLAQARHDLDHARAAMEGLWDWRAEEALGEARHRVADARIHLHNGAYRAADRSLDRAGALVRLVRRTAHELALARAAAEHAREHAAERAREQAAEHAREQAAEHARQHAAEHAREQAAKQAREHAAERPRGRRTAAYRGMPLASASATWTSSTVW